MQKPAVNVMVKAARQAGSVKRLHAGGAPAVELADDPDRLPLAHGERDAVDRLHRADDAPHQPLADREVHTHVVDHHDRSA